MNKFWSALTKNLEPYIPGEQPQDKKYIKLNTNENPYPPSPKVIEALGEAANEDLKLYPDPDSDALRDALGVYYKVDKDNVFVSNGSDEILGFSFAAFFNRYEKVKFPDISYSFYPVFASLFQIPYESVPLNDDFTISIEDYYNSENGVLIPNPNAPTGIHLNLDEIKNILKHNNGKVVIIDEAYVDFGIESAVSLIDRYANLLVIQTLSKSRSLAGLRVGFAIGDKKLIEGINRVKNSFNSFTVDRLASAGAIASIEDIDYFEENRRKIIETREETAKALVDFGFKVLPSSTNFLFISHNKVKAVDIYKGLKEEGILTRHFNQERIDNYIRVSIGTNEEMKLFLEKLKKII